MSNLTPLVLIISSGKYLLTKKYVLHHLSRANNAIDVGILSDQSTVVIKDFLLEHSELFEDKKEENQ